MKATAMGNTFDEVPDKADRDRRMRSGVTVRHTGITGIRPKPNPLCTYWYIPYIILLVVLMAGVAYYFYSNKQLQIREDEFFQYIYDHRTNK